MRSQSKNSTNSVQRKPKQIYKILLDTEKLYITNDFLYFRRFTLNLHPRTELQVKISTGHVKLQVYKHKSVLCTSKNKSASLKSLYQDLDYTFKLIPKSKPTFQKISSENFEFKKFSQRATILAFLFGHFPGVL